MRVRTRTETVTVALEDGAEFDFRPLTAAELGRLSREHTTVEVRRGRTYERFDAAGFGRAVWLAQVKGWRGLEDEDGRELPFSAAAAETVWEHNPDLCADALERLDEALAERGRARKNA